MRQLLQACRLCFKLIGNRFSHGFRSRRRQRRDRDREPGTASHQLQGRSPSPTAQDRSCLRVVRCKQWHADHSAVAGFSRLKLCSGEVDISYKWPRASAGSTRISPCPSPGTASVASTSRPPIGFRRNGGPLLDRQSGIVSELQTTNLGVRSSNLFGRAITHCIV
jgi:hypothetical protein